jgi:cation-transporting ATPase I
VVSHSLAHTGAGVSLAVAAVPEGLPFVFSAARRATARRLSVEVVLVRIPRTVDVLGRVKLPGLDETSNPG